MKQVYQFQPYSQSGLKLCELKATHKTYVKIALGKLSLLFMASVKSEPQAIVALYEYLSELASIQGQIHKEIKRLNLVLSESRQAGFKALKNKHCFTYQASVYPAVKLCEAITEYDQLMLRIEQCIVHQIIPNRRFIYRKKAYYQKLFQSWLGRVVNLSYPVKFNWDESQKTKLKQALNARKLMPQLSQNINIKLEATENI